MWTLDISRNVPNVFMNKPSPRATSTLTFLLTPRHSSIKHLPRVLGNIQAHCVSHWLSLLYPHYILVELVRSSSGSAVCVWEMMATPGVRTAAHSQQHGHRQSGSPAQRVVSRVESTMNLLAQLKERYTTSHTPSHGHGDMSRTSSATNTSRGSATQPPQPQRDVSPRAQSSFLLSTASGTTPQASRRLLAGEPSPEWSPGTGGSSRFTRGVASWSKAIAEVRAQAAAEVQAIQQRAAIEKYSVNSATAAPTLHALLTLTLALALLNPGLALYGA